MTHDEQLGMQCKQCVLYHHLYADNTIYIFNFRFFFSFFIFYYYHYYDYS